MGPATQKAFLDIVVIHGTPKPSFRAGRKPSGSVTGVTFMFTLAS